MRPLALLRLALTGAGVAGGVRLSSQARAASEDALTQNGHAEASAWPFWGLGGGLGGHKKKSGRGGRGGKGGIAGWNPYDRHAMLTDFKGPMWFFAAHHKAGTNLLHALAKIQVKALGVRLCTGTCGGNLMFGRPCIFSKTAVSERILFYCNTGAGEMERARRLAHGNFRGVQIIRDPLALVLSGYVYDMHYDDGMHANRTMRRSDTLTGVTMEAEFMVKSVLPGMALAYKRGKEIGDVLVLRMEDFMRSSESFDATVARLYNYTVGDFVSEDVQQNMRELAKSEDLHRHPEPVTMSAISPEHLKLAAKPALDKIPAELIASLHRFRKELDYADTP